MSPTIAYVILGFWAACAALVVGSLWIGCPDKSLDSKAEILRNMPSPRREIAYLCGLLALVIAAPLLLTYWLIDVYFDFLKRRVFFTAIRRTHRENVYEPLHPMNVPKIARHYFEEGAMDMLAIGFREIGRFRLKPEPVPSYGYCFHSPDHRTIGVLGTMLDSTYFSFSSTFANGIALETAAVEETPRLARANRSKNFRVVFAPGMSIAEGYARHQAAIASIEAEYATRALAVEPQQFHEVLTYEGRVYNQFLYELGEHDTPPPPAVLPGRVPLLTG